MALPAKLPPYRLAPDEKMNQVMIYTANSLLWGDLVVKSLIRVSTWLRTSAVADWLTLYNANLLVTNQGAAVKPVSFTEIHVPVTQIIAIHLIPPAQDPIDFDPTELNRRMEPVNAIFGSFMAKANLRISTNATLKKFIELNHEIFTGLYDIEVTSLTLQNFGTVKVPYILLRQATTVFTSR
ncbi:MAG: hypothetical protein ABSE06_03135 [Anaerolineaceae bacterium]|jgi:hypothetical protein